MRRISLFFHALVVGFEAQDCSPSGTRKHGILKMDTGRFSFKSPKKKIRQETKKKLKYPVQILFQQIHKIQIQKEAPNVNWRVFL